MYNPNNPYAGMVDQQRRTAAPGMASSGARPMQPSQGMSPGAGVRPMPRQQQAAPKKDGGMLGGLLSDENSKEEIRSLESANEALTKALSAKVEYPDTSKPSPGMQALGQQDSLPSQASFPDAPADKVAAQNVAMKPAAQQPPMGMQPNPSRSNMAMSQNPAFRVQGAPPDLSALDEAYRRMGQGG